ncbi:hypothetical protein EN866_33005 [Mesorhizobium sp. M2D.F.Ca.ET.223.01.1.1]|uniref:hypothetical protein n=1 Tax=Mesorhizobium sp. M2D.F.Ca.ET.223.01.1.1 TaxID=2563940 RepID=UPI0010933015|nr:hypothetical protein [Mesorhizobium sp. M2D.F.Ca.ET.223.01.1.1]TGR84571.1 hypothetical protein EN866_33005 [Mesorhizobium sp. M2D.F.Ca.ET.223.01.1.1]TGT75172.1 hypothetical protein EN802_09205 [bacterium M00.F.Ca.ET.159.01.1.1]TGT88039.1 hypothetical protein EN800_06095 [bacterium M00.F.Ca.ET.157.01.1.1]
MAVSRNIDPKLGVDLSKVYTSTDPFYARLPPVGTVTRALNGRMYVLAQASAGVANDTAVVLTEPAMTFAAGAGAWTTRSGAVNSGDRAWIESNAI